MKFAALFKLNVNYCTYSLYCLWIAFNVLNYDKSLIFLSEPLKWVSTQACIKKITLHVELHVTCSPT